MSLFNRTTVTKKLLNIIYTFFGKLEQSLFPPGHTHGTTDIETKCKTVFQSSLFFSSKKFPYRKMEKTWFY